MTRKKGITDYSYISDNKLNECFMNIEYYSSPFNARKKIKLESSEFSTITLAYLHKKVKVKDQKSKKKKEALRVLCDTGCSRTIIRSSFVQNFKMKSGDTIEWSTKTGTFNTNKQCEITFSMPQFHKDRDITWTVCVDENEEEHPRYDMILGRDLMHELGMIFDFKEGRMTWDNSWINMQNPSLFDEGTIAQFEEELFLMHDPDTTDAERIQEIVDAKYNTANLQDEVAKIPNLNREEKRKLYKLLKIMVPCLMGY